MSFVMYPGHWSQVKPNTPALIHAATGEEVSWLELDQRSNQVANLLQTRGLKPGDHVSILMENHKINLEYKKDFLHSN